MSNVLNFNNAEYAQYEQFCNENDRFPQNVKGEEGQLYRFALHKRKLFELDGLSDRDLLKIKEQYPNLYRQIKSQIVKPGFESNLKSYKSWLIAYKDIPHINSRNAEENRLATWMTNNKHAYEHGKLSQDRIDRIKEFGESILDRRVPVSTTKYEVLRYIIKTLNIENSLLDELNITDGSHEDFNDVYKLALEDIYSTADFIRVVQSELAHVIENGDGYDRGISNELDKKYRLNNKNIYNLYMQIMLGGKISEQDLLLYKIISNFTTFSVEAKQLFDTEANLHDRLMLLLNRYRLENDKNDRYIQILIYRIYGDKCTTLSELSDKLGLSRARIEQILNKVIDKLSNKRRLNIIESGVAYDIKQNTPKSYYYAPFGYDESIDENANEIDITNISIKTLGMSTRSTNTLLRNNISTLGGLYEFTGFNYGCEESDYDIVTMQLNKLRNIGAKSTEEILRVCFGPNIEKMEIPKDKKSKDAEPEVLEVNRKNFGSEIEYMERFIKYALNN